jgi:ACT domain-containing protein
MSFAQAKEYLPASALRRIVTLQTELMKDTTKSKGNTIKLSAVSMSHFYAYQQHNGHCYQVILDLLSILFKMERRQLLS